MKAFDRPGTLGAGVAWTAPGAPEIGWVRLPDGSWLAIEPRPGADARGALRPALGRRRAGAPAARRS